MINYSRFSNPELNDLRIYPSAYLSFGLENNYEGPYAPMTREKLRSRRSKRSSTLPGETSPPFAPSVLRLFRLFCASPLLLLPRQPFCSHLAKIRPGTVSGHCGERNGVVALIVFSPREQRRASKIFKKLDFEQSSAIIL